MTMLIPVHNNVFHNLDPLIQQQLNTEVSNRIIAHFGTRDVVVKALTGVEIRGISYPDWVFLECKRTSAPRPVTPRSTTERRALRYRMAIADDKPTPGTAALNPVQPKKKSKRKNKRKRMQAHLQTKHQLTQGNT
jgi:hypothetical protein